MKRVYIDFDSTLYNTGIIKKNMNDIIADGVCENALNCDKNVVLDEIKQAKENGVKSVIGLCKFFENILFKTVILLYNEKIVWEGIA